MKIENLDEEFGKVVYKGKRKIIFAYDLKEFFEWAKRAKSKKELEAYLYSNAYDRDAVKELLELIEMVEYDGQEG